MVEQLCRLTDEAARLRAVLGVVGMTLRTPVQSAKGEVVAERVMVRPALAMHSRIGRESAEVAGELGLSPAGRRRLGLEVPAEPREPDWLDELRNEHAARRGEPNPGIDGRR
jgi:hypothetical protein